MNYFVNYDNREVGRYDRLKLDNIESLIDDYGNIIYKFCIKISKNKEEDLYQQTFLKV